MEPPKEAPRLSNTFENRDGRLHSPFAAQFPQKSAPGYPDAMHVRGAEYPSVRHGQDHGRTALPKDKNKEGTGYRLLNMLRKTLKGSESEELEVTPEIPTLVPFGDVVGCLAIHIKNCRHFMSKISSQHYTNLFIRISINNVVKSTKLCSLLSRNDEKVSVIKFDEVKYFSIKVPRRQDDERNNIYLELMQHDSTEKYPLFLGSSELHLYEVIQKGCFTEELQMMNKNTFICRVEVEFMFSYGNFGYGFSHQLKPLQKIIEPSMFMKVAPPPERTDPVTNVILPQPVEYPAFLSPDLNVTVGIPNTMPQLNQPSMVRLEKLQQQPRERLEQMKTEYRNLRTWMEKVGYLDKIINPKLEDKDSKEIMNVEALESQHSNLFDKMPEDTLTLVSFSVTAIRGVQSRISFAACNSAAVKPEVLSVKKLRVKRAMAEHINENLDKASACRLPSAMGPGRCIPRRCGQLNVSSLQLFCDQSIDRKQLLFRKGPLRNPYRVFTYSGYCQVSQWPPGKTQTTTIHLPSRRDGAWPPEKLCNGISIIDYNGPVLGAGEKEKLTSRIETGTSPIAGTPGTLILSLEPRRVYSSCDIILHISANFHESCYIFVLPGSQRLTAMLVRIFIGQSAKRRRKRRTWPRHQRDNPEVARPPTKVLGAQVLVGLRAPLRASYAQFDVPPEDKEDTPTELPDSDEKEDFTIPYLKQLYHDDAIAGTPKSDGSTTLSTDTALPSVPSLEITEGKKIQPLSEHLSEDVPGGKMKNLLFPPDVKSCSSNPRILKADSSLAEVAFSPKENNSPFFRPLYREFTPDYQVSPKYYFFQFQKFHLGSFDPFLRNINNKMSDRIKKDKYIYKSRSLLYAEEIELEDQDPPYPTCSQLAEPTVTSWAHDPGVTMKTLNPEDKVAPDPTVNSVKTLDTKDKLPRETLPNVFLPSFKRESSVTENVNKGHISKSLSPTSHIEKLRQSMVLKSVLSKNLQELSDKLFSKPQVPVNPEAIKKSSSSHLSFHNEPASSIEDPVFEKIQDLHSWLSEKDILNSKSLLSQVIKNVSTDFLSEDGPGKSPEVAESVSEKYLEADEIDFPMTKKSSFKKKHLISEVSSCKSSFHGSVPDCVIKQIFTAPMSRLEMGVTESSEADMNLQDQLPTRWGGSLSSHVLVHYGEENDEIELPQSKSAVSQIIQAFPIETLLESGLIKVIELDKEYQRSSLLDTAAASREEPEYSTAGFTEIKSTAEPLSRQNTPTIPKETAFSSRVGLLEEDPKMPPQHSAFHLRPEKKPVLPSNGHRLDREENDLSSILENLSNSIMSKLDDSDAVMLKSFLRSILKAFFTHNQSEVRRQPEKELERLIKNDFPSFTEHLEETPGNLKKADTLHRKPVLNARLRVFLEELSETEVKNLKSELSKQIQHYLVERLSEAGHIAKEDLPKIYQNLYLMNEKADLKAQNDFQEKYSETVRQIMSFVNNFNHHFIDKHLEIKLRSFLNEILQNYFLKNLSESSLFRETESEAIHNNIASLRTKSAPLSYPELGQEITSGSFGRRLEINMKYPLNKSLQKYLLALSENELLSLKADLSKHFQSLFIEKLSKAGLVTERQLEGINHHLRLLNSSSTPLKCIKSALPVRDDNHLMAEHSEKENKYSKTVPKNTLQKTPKDQCVETKLIRREDNDYFFLHNLKENPATIKEDKSYYPREEAKTLSLVKIQPSSNKNIQAIALNKSPERLTDMLLKKPRKEHGSVQFPQAEQSLCKTEHQDPYGWGSKSKVTQSKACFDMTLKMKPLEKKEHINIYKLTVQERPKAVLSPYPRIPNSKIPREDEKHLDRLTFPSWQTNTLGYFNSETGEKPKQEQYCQRLKGNNNNNKRHVVTFAQYSQEIQSLYLSPNEICDEKYARIPESQSFKIIEDREDSRSSFFPEVLKRENLKLKVRKERDYAAKPKKSFNKVVRMLPSALPTTRSHLRKSVPRTLLHWTARRTIHDCSDKFEDLPVTSLKHLTKTKSRARLLGKSPDDSHNQAKHSARPYTAPEHYKRRENHTARFGGPRMVSAGLVHINDTTIDYEIRKMHPPKKLKEDIEKCSLICDIIQMLNSSK
ncbi:cation channel sperm-associated targeting subunit tau [Lepus europaeus]|uniref:cation channel sperm-associated targeting subunit tau n=1 Tax=Lepus europaeus TaxID=9983 RepID=UPI002B47C211|nr:cation channel sperm-associated targeting subunit tau [Lepus europaeus]